MQSFWFAFTFFIFTLAKVIKTFAKDLMFLPLRKFYCLVFFITAPLTAASRKRQLTVEVVPAASSAARNAKVGAFPFKRQGALAMHTDRRDVRYMPLAMEPVGAAMPSAAETRHGAASMSAEPLPSLVTAITDEDIHAVYAALERGERLSAAEITAINPTDAIREMLTAYLPK